MDRDLILAKIIKKEKTNKTIEKLTKKYPVKVIDDKKEYYLLEICSGRHQEEEILKELENLEVQELVRTGKIAISR